MENVELLEDANFCGGKYEWLDGKKVDVQGIDNHQMNDIPLVTAGGVIHTNKGDVIAILHNYAYTGKGTSIHSSGQIESFNNVVHDKSMRVGGKQRIITLDNYIIPLNVVNGLPRLPMTPFTDKQWEQLPHVFLTGETDWDPRSLDNDFSTDTSWYDPEELPPDDDIPPRFDHVGDYNKRVHVSSHEIPSNCDVDQAILYHASKLYFDPSSRPSPASSHPSGGTQSSGDSIHSSSVDVTSKPPDYDKQRPLFAWLPTSTIKKTYELTTQLARLPFSTILKKRFKSPNPALNIHRRNEPVATDTIYSDTPAIDSGVKQAQLFVGCDTMLTDVYPLKTDK